MATGPRPFVGVMAGIAAGLVASAAMSAFSAATAKLLDHDDDEETGDPSSLKAAEKASEAILGEPLPAPYRKPAGHAVHYVAGAVLGGIYGLITEYRPEASAGFGSAYGMTISVLLDEIAVPAAGLSAPIDEAPLESHVRGAAAHLAFGVVLEGVRWLLAGRREG